MQQFYFWYSELDGLPRIALFYAVLVFGGVCSFFLFKASANLRRGPFFALMGLAGLVHSVFGMMLVPLFVPLLNAGLGGVLAIVEITGVFALGLTFQYLAKCRSLDAFGRTWPALLIWIPPFYFALMFWRSRPDEGRPMFPESLNFSGSTGVLVGVFAAFIGGQIDKRSEQAATTILDEAKSSGELDPALRKASMFVLDQAYRSPQPDDDLFKVHDVRSDDPVFEVKLGLFDPEDAGFIPLRHELAKGFCGDEAVREFLQRGGTFVMQYLAPDQLQPVTEYRLTKLDCMI